MVVSTVVMLMPAMAMVAVTLSSWSGGSGPVHDCDHRYLAENNRRPLELRPRTDSRG